MPTASRIAFDGMTLAAARWCRTASLPLWCWRREENTGCKQNFAHLLPDEIAAATASAISRAYQVISWESAR
jgi:hypothetical protein